MRNGFGYSGQNSCAKCVMAIWYSGRDGGAKCEISGGYPILIFCCEMRNRIKYIFAFFHCAFSAIQRHRFVHGHVHIPIPMPWGHRFSLISPEVRQVAPTSPLLSKQAYLMGAEWGQLGEPQVGSMKSDAPEAWELECEHVHGQTDGAESRWRH